MSTEDKAQELEAAMWEHNNRTRDPLPTYSTTDAGYGPAECEECGDDMPDVRRASGYRLCTPCAAEVEKYAKRR